MEPLSYDLGSLNPCSISLPFRLPSLFCSSIILNGIASLLISSDETLKEVASVAEALAQAYADWEALEG